jgi:GMP synthase-like glutamine amidotransferase
MRAHYFQHVPFEGLGSIEPWLKAAGYEITVTRFFESAELPNPERVDLLIVMGGPMSVNDEVEYPWLAREKDFIRDAIDSGTPVLGICLGAQLIASALGAKVYPNSVKEIGWFPIEGIAEHDESMFRFPSTMDTFHWHGETFDLPVGAIALARSEACENQAFQIGCSVIGLQCHLEMTPTSVRAIVEDCRAELTPSRYVQSEAEILSSDVESYRAMNDVMGNVLSFLLQNNQK